MKISFANTLSNICESIPNANIDDVTRALGADRRISPFYLKGGLAYGGPCFPRDNRAFAAFAKKYGYKALLAEATDAVNKLQTKRLLEHTFRSFNKRQSVIGVLGIAYKPNTPVVEESAGMKIAEEILRNTSTEVVVYDPLAMYNAQSYFGNKVIYASSIASCLSKATLCIITIPTEEFKQLKKKDFPLNVKTIIDCWRILDPKNLPSHVQYIGLGRFSSKVTP